MVNQVVLAVSLGLVAGFVVVIIYFMVQFFRHRSVTNEYKYKKLTSDPAYVSRAVIKQDIPPFYIPQSVPVPLQQPIRSERSGSISKDDYRNGHSLLSPTVHSVNVKRKEEECRTGIQLNAINTGSICSISPQPSPRSPKPPRKVSRTKKQSPQKEILLLPQHRKVAVYKKFPDSNLGKLEFTIYYDKSFRLLQIYVTRGIKIVSSEDNIPPDILVIASLSFSKNQIWEQKTRLVKNSNDPQFNEKLEAHGIASEKLLESTLHFQLFNDRANTIIGEVEYPLKELPPNKLTSQILPLIPVEIDETYCNIEDAIPVSPSELGELSISLCHNPTDQKLTVKLNCARALQAITKDGRLNPFVKLEVTFCGRKLSSQTTKTAHNTLTPNFSEVFVFDMHSDKLPQVTLIFKVKHRGRMRDVSLGTVHLGYCVNVESEYKHWEQVLEKPHLEIEQWHPIQEYFVE